MADTKPKRLTKGPRMRSRSERVATMMIRIHVRRYGGADSPFDWMLEKTPISLMIVGTNRGREAKDTLQEK